MQKKAPKWPLYGLPLKRGDAIGVISLSSPCERSRFESGIKFLKSLGFKPKIALNPWKAYGKHAHLFSSDSAVKRARAFEELFIDPQVKVIIAARGGYGAMEVLPHINFKIIAKHPKLVVGFSDFSVALLALDRLGIPSLHGPSVEGGLGKAHAGGQEQRSASALFGFLQGEYPQPFKGHKVKRLSGSSKAVSGKLVGGNLTTISHLMGTAWEPNFDGRILFLEDVGEKPYRVHRMLLQLKLAGKFSKVSAILFGTFNNCADLERGGPDVRAVFKDITADLACPVYNCSFFGHQALNLPVPLGLKARLSSKGLTLLETL